MMSTQREREATTRAEKLLGQHLTPKQRRDWRKYGAFAVSVGPRVYQIAPSVFGYPIGVVATGEEDHLEALRFAKYYRLFVGTRLGLLAYFECPNADLALTLKLFLEADEIRLLCKACRSRYRLGSDGRWVEIDARRWVRERRERLGALPPAGM